jgi:hypothetical protein
LLPVRLALHGQVTSEQGREVTNKMGSIKWGQSKNSGFCRDCVGALVRQTWLDLAVLIGNRNGASTATMSSGKRPAMWKPHDEYLALGSSRQSRQTAYRQLVAQQLPGNVVTDRRGALNTGLVLGNDCFREQVQTLTGVRQQHLKRGPRQEN